MGYLNLYNNLNMLNSSMNSAYKIFDKKICNDFYFFNNNNIINLEIDVYTNIKASDKYMKIHKVSDTYKVILMKQELNSNVKNTFKCQNKKLHEYSYSYSYEFRYICT